MSATHNPEEKPFWDFTHRDYRPDHKPIPQITGVPLGPLDPKKAWGLLSKAARKHAPNAGASKAATTRTGGIGKAGGGKK